MTNPFENENATYLVLIRANWRRAVPFIPPVLLWFLAPVISLGAYFLYLHSRTGDWDAWRHAQERSWHRTPHGLGESWAITWRAAFAPNGRH